MMVLIVVVVLDCCPCVALGAELRWSVVALGAVLNFCYFQVPTIKNEQNMKEINTKEQKGRKRNKRNEK